MNQGAILQDDSHQPPKQMLHKTMQDHQQPLRPPG